MNIGCSIIGRVLLAVWVFMLLFPDAAAARRRSHEVFFEGTDYELHVYRIYGNLPGKTLLLIGGIQGDEPGGFLSADHYADISLAKGNLIVVPRANFHSIVLQRRKINSDMNREFAHESERTYETKIVAILKRLIQESDCLLNLHDGSGFYADTWEGPDRNPLRYGQSIIADTDVYRSPETGRVLFLGDMARSVAAQINRQIENPRHHFRFNNHRTQEEGTPHREQRKSATYYALYSCGVPAFGIESSKQLPLELKVRHHNLAINAFMDHLGIQQETPGVNLDPPELDYLVLSVNDALPVVVRNRQTLTLSPGDTVMVSHIEANYERGLTADLLGHGTLSDLRKSFKISSPTQVVVRKDYYPCGRVLIALKGAPGKIVAADAPSAPVRPVEPGPVLGEFRIRVNGAERSIKNHERIELVRGDLLEIVEVTADHGDPSQWVVNFKGYVGDRKSNSGEDRGYVINTATDLWKRYSLNGRGNAYQVIVTCKEAVVGKLFVDLNDPETGKGAPSK